MCSPVADYVRKNYMRSVSPHAAVSRFCRTFASMTEGVFIDIHTHRWPPEGRWSVCCVPPEGLARALAGQAGVGHWHALVSSGVHPWRAAEEGADDALALLEQWADDPRLVAIGECGLDKYAPAPLARQLDVFARQARLAERAGKPLVVHCVGRVAELLALRRRIHPAQAWVVHGFRGKPPLAEELLRAGCALSFGERFNPASVRVTPLERLFVETDESALPIADIYARVAEAKECPPADLAGAGARLIGLGEAGMSLLTTHVSR